MHTQQNAEESEITVEGTESLHREIELLKQHIALLRSEISVLKAAADFFYKEHVAWPNDE